MPARVPVLEKAAQLSDDITLPPSVSSNSRHSEHPRNRIVGPISSHDLEQFNVSPPVAIGSVSVPDKTACQNGDGVNDVKIALPAIPKSTVRNCQINPEKLLHPLEHVCTPSRYTRDEAGRVQFISSSGESDKSKEMTRKRSSSEADL